MPVTCRLTEVLDDAWLKVEPVRIGPVPSTLPAPDIHVLVEVDGVPRRRFDLYVPPESLNVCTVAQVWADWIVIGYCNRVLLVPAAGGETVETSLHDGESSGFDYFSGLWPTSDFMLVATGEGLLRMDPDGSMRWRNLRLGLDGVVIDAVEGEVIRGRGDWDPPGGWRDFAINVSSGKAVE